MHKEFLDAVIRVNKELYLTIKNNFKDSWYSEYEVGAGGDISSGIDLYAEKLFVEALSKFGAIDSEECGKIGSGRYTIIIDPIDGSSNFASNFPYFGSSVALKDGDKTLVAVVCNFANGDVFYRVEADSVMFGNILEENFEKEKCVQNPKIGLFEKAYENSEVVDKLTKKNLKFRAPGATALSLAYAHRVKFVLFMGEIREYDIVAGIAFCRDLQVSITKNYVIVTKDIEILNTIETIINEVE